MMFDFREVKAQVMATVKAMDKKDPDWKWKAVVLKSQVKIFWSYLEYKGETPPFIITHGSKEKGECGIDDPFIVLRNEHDEYMSGRIVENTSYGDGTLEDCVVSLMEHLQRRVNLTY